MGEICSKRKSKSVHFCQKESKTKFLYNLHGNIDRIDRESVSVCQAHFGDLCSMAYTSDHKFSIANYFSDGQKEYVAIKRLESQLDVIDTIQFK